jgi:hypothetical protein
VRLRSAGCRRLAGVSALFAIAACRAAFSAGGSRLRELLSYCPHCGSAELAPRAVLMKWTGHADCLGNRGPGHRALATTPGCICWGRCTLENFLRLNVPGGLLLAGNGIASGIPAAAQNARPARTSVSAKAVAAALSSIERTGIFAAIAGRTPGKMIESMLEFKVCFLMLDRVLDWVD